MATLQVRATARTTDRPRAKPETFARARKVENFYARALRRVARVVGEIIGAFPAGDPQSLPGMAAALARYAEALEPWARATAGRMIAEVAHRDRRAFEIYAGKMSRALREELQSAPTGAALRQYLDENVALIKSLPIEAGRRVHDLTIKGLEDSTRASEIAKEIMRSGEVTESRATLIARTETSRTATGLTKARAEHVGSTHFIWRTAEDSDVRPSHRKLDGKVFRWDEPPECDPGHHALPGAIWNCRCYPEPILPEIGAD